MKASKLEIGKAIAVLIAIIGVVLAIYGAATIFSHSPYSSDGLLAFGGVPYLYLGFALLIAGGALYIVFSKD